MSASAALEVQELRKSYVGPGGPLEVLAGVSFSLNAGEALCVMGPSGSGKSTLLHLLGVLDRPSSGSVRLHGQDPFALAEREQAAFRNAQVGFVFQDHCLLPQLSALENVLVPSLAGKPPAGIVERARGLLERVGLGPRAAHRPAELSGGEQQRVALARALLLAPRLVLCDEPTGNLDAASAALVAELLVELQRDLGTLLVLATHSAELSARFPRRARLVQGRLQPS